MSSREVKFRTYSTAALLAAAFAGPAFGQEVSITGATLFEPFFRSTAAGNDVIDVDNDGLTTVFPTSVDTLWTSDGGNSGLNLQYRAIGSGNGFQELIDYGSVNGPGTDWATLDGINGGAPNNRNGSQGVSIATFSGPAIADISTTDVPTTWFVTDTRPGANWNNAPFTGGAPTPGYGNNPAVSNAVTTPTGDALQAGGQSNKLKSLTPTSNSPGSTTLTLDTSLPNAVYQTPIALAPIAFIANAGAAVDSDYSTDAADGNIKKTELQHLFVSGRMTTGENLVAITRDSGSGTRNGAMNSIGVDPSYGVGDNVGLRNRGSSSPASTGSLDTPGPDYIPTNKNSSSRLENTVQATRLGVSYNGIVGNAGPESAANEYEILNVANDLDTGWDGSSYVRPIMQQIASAAGNNVIFNGDPNTGHQIGAVQTLSTIGNPFAGTIIVATDGTARFDDAANALAGEKVFDPTVNFASRDNTGDAMADPTAALWVRNLIQSIDDFVAVPTNVENVGTPGEALASSFALTSAAQALGTDDNPGVYIANPNENTDLQAASVLPTETIDASYGGDAGSVPFRDTSATYSDGLSANYITNAGAAVAYGTTIAGGSVNAIAGDFDANGVRDTADIDDLVVAYEAADAGTRNTLAQSDQVLEIIGDFDADGNFDLDDVRYGADGLFNRGRAGDTLDRKQNFIDVDAAATGGNIFGTTLATGKSYVDGDSRGDVAGSGLESPGWAPQGWDGVVNGLDIDYVWDQFVNNDFITDGAANWADLDEAVGFDLSADMTGDLIVNDLDITEIVEEILGTVIGDVNLDGSVTQADLDIATG